MKRIPHFKLGDCKSSCEVEYTNETKMSVTEQKETTHRLIYVHFPSNIQFAHDIKCVLELRGPTTLFKFERLTVFVCSLITNANYFSLKKI